MRYMVVICILTPNIYSEVEGARNDEYIVLKVKSSNCNIIQLKVCCKNRTQSKVK